MQVIHIDFTKPELLKLYVAMCFSYQEEMVLENTVSAEFTSAMYKVEAALIAD